MLSMKYSILCFFKLIPDKQRMGGLDTSIPCLFIISTLEIFLPLLNKLFNIVPITILQEFITGCFILFLYPTYCPARSALCELPHCAPPRGKNRSPAYLLQGVPDRRSCDGDETQCSCSRWKHTHQLELKQITSAAMLELCARTQTHLVEFMGDSFNL